MTTSDFISRVDNLLGESMVADHLALRELRNGPHNTPAHRAADHQALTTVLSRLSGITGETSPPRLAQLHNVDGQLRDHDRDMPMHYHPGTRTREVAADIDRVIDPSYRAGGMGRHVANAFSKEIAHLPNGAHRYYSKDVSSLQTPDTDANITALKAHPLGANIKTPEHESQLRAMMRDDDNDTAPGKRPEWHKTADHLIHLHLEQLKKTDPAVHALDRHGYPDAPPATTPSQSTVAAIHSWLKPVSTEDHAQDQLRELKKHVTDPSHLPLAAHLLAHATPLTHTHDENLEGETMVTASSDGRVTASMARRGFPDGKHGHESDLIDADVREDMSTVPEDAAFTAAHMFKAHDAAKRMLAHHNELLDSGAGEHLTPEAHAAASAIAPLNPILRPAEFARTHAAHPLIRWFANAAADHLPSGDTKDPRESFISKVNNLLGEGDLDERRAGTHAGIHNYLKHGYDVVYHGRVGRFHIYSAHKMTANPADRTGALHDISQEPRMSGPGVHGTDNYLPAGLDEHPHLDPGPHDANIRHLSDMMDSDPSLHNSIKRQMRDANLESLRTSTHRAGAFAFANAHHADAQLTRLGLPQHKLTVVVTHDPIDNPVEYNNTGLPIPSKPAPHPLRYGGAADGSTAIAQYARRVHHASLDTNIAGGAIDSHTIAHEWVHHHQAQLSKDEKRHLSWAFDKSTTTSRRMGSNFPFARDYGKTNWSEWQATSIEGAVKNRQKLHPLTMGALLYHDRNRVKDIASPRTVKKALNPYESLTSRITTFLGEAVYPDSALDADTIRREAIRHHMGLPPTFGYKVRVNPSCHVVTTPDGREWRVWRNMDGSVSSRHPERHSI